MLQQVAVYVNNAELQRFYKNYPKDTGVKVMNKKQYILCLCEQCCVCVHFRNLRLLRKMEQTWATTPVCVCFVFFSIRNNRSEVYLISLCKPWFVAQIDRLDADSPQ